ncbi:MAG: sugar ABC transporter ATP-binding protein [Clostridia bacterium]|nr:sugar ABC transporter ATP-binding protein [Clostridia bacterium]
MTGMTKSFPGVRALDDVSLEIRAGEVHALMGENGAGKSTLMKCLFGVYKPDGGQILLDGREVSFRSPKEALLGGVAMVHQELEQAGKMTVADNIWLGRFPRVKGFLPIVSDGEARRRSAELFASLGINISPTARVESLGVGERQLLEIAKAVSYGAKIIVFDEPTSSLTEKEAAILFSIIERLKADGCGIIYISHKMSEILKISDRVTVMRDGRHIATEERARLTTEKIIKLMVGRELTERYPRLDEPTGEVLLSVENLSAVGTRLKNATLSVRAGEILGIGGLDGSGRTELFECIFGLSKRASGHILLNGREMENRNPREAIKNGFALLTEERRVDGIFGILDLTDNTTVSSLRDYLRGPLLSSAKMREKTRSYIDALKIKTPSEGTKIRSLSGGNQQKVILSRWLLTKPRVLLLDEPTRGIDVGAKYDIYLLMKELAAAGCAILMISSEMSELIGASHRVAVMSAGRIAGEIKSSEATQEGIMTLAAKYL